MQACKEATGLEARVSFVPRKFLFDYLLIEYSEWISKYAHHADIDASVSVRKAAFLFALSSRNTGEFRTGIHSIAVEARSWRVWVCSRIHVFIVKSCERVSEFVHECGSRNAHSKIEKILVHESCSSPLVVVYYNYGYIVGAGACCPRDFASIAAEQSW